jgi:Domain of unknown function (DUF4365)
MPKEAEKVPNPLTERVGVNAVEAITNNVFGWFFREQPIGDYGVDAHIEEMVNGRPTGKLIALQIKTGKSYFRPQGDDFVFYGAKRHLEYWTHHRLPVYVIIHDPENGLTLWQKFERRLVKESAKRWSITIPSSNILNAEAKRYFEMEIAADPESIRRFNLAVGYGDMKLFSGREVYFQVNEWVNKSLNMRDVGVYFDDPYKDTPDHMFRFWTPAPSLESYMARFFPWLDFDYVEDSEEIGGEVVVHTLSVRLNNIAQSFMTLEEYYAHGASEQEVPQDEYQIHDEDELDATYIDRAIMRDPFT